MRRLLMLAAAGAAASTLNLLAADALVRCGIEMRNVALHAADGVVLDVRRLDGEFVARTAGRPPVFDDPSSYIVRLRDANIGMDALALNGMLRPALAAKSSPISDVTIELADGRLHAKGKLHKGITVPFSMTAVVSATPDGRLRLHAEKLKAIGVPVKGLLDLLGLDVADLMKMPPGSGIRAEGDDLLLDATALMPPPRMEGRVRTVAINGNRLALRLQGGATPQGRPATLPLPSAKNYLYFYGGSIRFGKLTMTDADMQLIDADPSNAFDFYPAKYEDQLVAGYSRNTRRKGLQVFMPDYARTRANGGILKAPRLR
jgi:hypothetical protein